MKTFNNKGFTLVEITLVMVLISILIAITTPLVSNVIARNDVGTAHESLYNSLLRAQQLSKNQYKNSQWRVCLDNTNKQYTITSGTCSDPTNAEIIKISSNITMSSEQTLDILFKAISGELDNTSNSITINLTGGGVSKSIVIKTSGVIDKDSNTAPAPNITPSIITNGLVLNLDSGNINSYPGLNGTGDTWFDLSSSNNNGKFFNGVRYDSANGGGFVFDGVNDYIDVPLEQNIADSNEITAELFVKINGTTTTSTDNWGGQYLIFRRNSRTGQFEGFHIAFRQTTNKFSIQSTPSSGTPQATATSSTDVSYNTIYHVAGTFKSNDAIKIYVNGNLENITNISHNLDIPSTRTLKFGRSASPTFDGPANATIYNAKVYNRVLSPEEIQQNFNASKGRFGL
jgi:prepilin-type N-terminal cleavage/methylation domain-containing protein